MNTPNNKRRQESKRKIEKVFCELLKSKELNQIKVTDICKAAGVNRTTFYASYVDVYDLAEAVQQNLHDDVMSLYTDEVSKQTSTHDFLRLFEHIKANPDIYRIYFKLNSGKGLKFVMYDREEAASHIDMRYVDYHIEFFGNGLNAVIKKWLDNGCRERPEEINRIIIEEYRRIL